MHAHSMKTTAQLIVALDVPRAADAEPLLDAIGDAVQWYKVGLELFTAEGLAALEPLRARGKSVFLDLKLHDIPNTVARAVDAAAALRVGLLTVHAGGGRAMLEAAAMAARTAGPHAPTLVAVPVLTSLGDADLIEVGVREAAAPHALRLARLAQDCGIAGLVSSAHEVAELRAQFGLEPVLVTPGIRPAGGASGDQKRVATPAMAVRAGSSFLVVGRPILQAPDPRAAALAILEEMRLAG